LLPNTTYYYFIKAKNSSGESDFSSPAASVVSPNTKPTAPTGVKAEVYRSVITVSWNPDPVATSYEVWYRVDRNTLKERAGSSTSNTFSHSVNTIKSIISVVNDDTISRIISPTGSTQQTVYYYVKAKNSAGESDFSLSSAGVTISK
jgi:hypothetical protein